MREVEVLMETEELTVVGEYKGEGRKSTEYQSEAALEGEFIKQLVGQGYEYIGVRTSGDLEVNLREQLGRLNGIEFSDIEWERLYGGIVANKTKGILEKTELIQEDYVQSIELEDGTKKNIKLIEKKSIHNNKVQVINQYESEGKRSTRYDVTILVNGLPLVHVELKRRGVALREAFNQINRYQRDSFWADSGLFEYVQVFVITNGTNTKYYSNTTRDSQVESSRGKEVVKVSNTFEFTSYWTDANNKLITDLVDFTGTFFQKGTLLNILTKYCVFTADRNLLVMRPYQIVATERILNKTEMSNNYNKFGSIQAGGYVWHTTGSGKTLTSFKTAQLLREKEYIKKVIFVVDRQDLDYQTMKEYDKFEKGAANSNSSTSVLQKQIEDSKVQLIVTTIQKLDTFIRKNAGHSIYKEKVVMIFDECHRSQFGLRHKRIIQSFKKYILYGFTGTPIFGGNAGGKYGVQTTEQVFGDRLHTYTIVNAIRDKNVLPFKVDYINTLKFKEEEGKGKGKKKGKKKKKEERVQGIDTEGALIDPKRIEEVTGYILDNFDKKTYRGRNKYMYKMTSGGTTRKVSGFNSIFAVGSIAMAKAYYEEFKEQNRGGYKIATIFTYSANGEEEDRGFDNTKLDKTSRDFLELVIEEYNEMFGTKYDTGSFQSYYRDIAKRMKSRELDLVIVVDMFLTGFDAPTMNTLWVDKPLKAHGLIQAFSRTNRILNTIKVFGNIVCFRGLEEETNKALKMFGDGEYTGIATLKTLEEYINGYEEEGEKVKGYKELVEELQKEYPVGEEIVGESRQKEYIRKFGDILKLGNLLEAFDGYSQGEYIAAGVMQDYTSKYIDMYEENKRGRESSAKEDISDDIVFELELIKRVEINIDYILGLIESCMEEKEGESKEELVKRVNKLVDSTVELRSKRSLIEKFIGKINMEKGKENVGEDWGIFVEKELTEDIEKLVEEERLDSEATVKYIRNSVKGGKLKIVGKDFDEILPPISRFGGSNRGEVKERVLGKVTELYNKYYGA